MSATPPHPEEHAPLPRGLVLFAPGTEPRKRRRRLAFVAFYLLLTAALVWPVYPRFSGIRPLILGLPLSLSWIVLILCLGFAALVALHLAEDEPDRGKP